MILRWLSPPLALLLLALNAGPVAAAEFSAEREGARLNLRLQADGARLIDGEAATIELRLTDQTGGQPIRGLRPALWIDNRGTLAHPGGREASCRERVGTYAKGNVGSRPLVDLNGYYLLSLNRDPTISVIDPLVGISGRTNLLTNIILPRPGADWAEHTTRRRLLVTMPRANQVAMIDTENMRLLESLNTGREPVRVVTQQSGPLAFTGNNGDASVTVIDLAQGKAVDTIAVGKGHHELELVEALSRLFVTNREDASVSVIDTARRSLIRTEPLAGKPSALTHSAVGGAVFVAAGPEGHLLSLDAGSGVPGVRMRLGAPIDALYATPDGRLLLALSTEAKAVHVLDASNLRAVQRIALPGAPYQVVYTAAYAHIRMYDTERVALLPLADLAKAQPPVLGGYAAGTGAPRRETVAVMAPGLSTSPDAGAVVVANPADGRLHYYMEGMNATSGSFRNYGHVPQAVRTTERSLKEVSPGVYAARLRLPTSGQLSVVLRLDQPRLTECFDFEVAVNPAIKAAETQLQLGFALAPPAAPGTAPATVRLRITNATGASADLPEGSVLRHFRAPGLDRGTSTLTRVAQGVYEAQVAFSQQGAYYLQIDGAATLTPPYLSVLIREQ